MKCARFVAWVQAPMMLPLLYSALAVFMIDFHVLRGNSFASLFPGLSRPMTANEIDTIVFSFFINLLK